MTVAETPPGTHSAARLLGGRFRLDERIGLDDQVSGFSGPCGSWWEARGLSLWKATDQLLGRPVTIYLLPPGLPVPPAIVDAVQSAAKVIDARIATIYDTDFNPECPYIVAEWTPGTHLEDLLRSGRPTPALAAAMIADAADAVAVAHRAGRPHLRLTPRTLRWHPRSGLKITGLGLDEALFGPAPGGPQDPGVPDPMTADTVALARMLYALLTGYWPGDEAAARSAGLPAAPRHKGQVCTPRQVRAGVPAVLDVITYRALRGQAADAPLRAQTLAGLAMALRMVQRPSRLLEGAGLEPAELDTIETDEAAVVTPIRRRPARHARARTGLGLRTTLLRPALRDAPGATTHARRYREPLRYRERSSSARVSASSRSPVRQFPAARTSLIRVATCPASPCAVAGAWPARSSTSSRRSSSWPVSGYQPSSGSQSAASAARPARTPSRSARSSAARRPGGEEGAAIRISRTRAGRGSGPGPARAAEWAAAVPCPSRSAAGRARGTRPSGRP